VWDENKSSARRARNGIVFLERSVKDEGDDVKSPGC
jgi:hypothetical protein